MATSPRNRKRNQQSNSKSSNSTSTDQSSPQKQPPQKPDKPSEPSSTSPSILRHPVFLLVVPVFLLATHITILLEVAPKCAEPFFGNVLSHTYFPLVAVGALILGWMAVRVYSTRKFKKITPQSLYDLAQLGISCSCLIALFFAASPNIWDVAFDVASDVGKKYDGQLGALTFHGFVAFPVMFLSGLTLGVLPYATLKLNADMDDQKLHFLYARVTVPCLWYITSFLIRFGLEKVEIRAYEIIVLMSLSISFLAVLASVLYAPPPSRKRQLRLAIVVVIVAIATNNLLNHPHVQRGVVQSLHNPPTETVYKILDRAESNTGFISVFEESTRKIRILRAGHSVIGGMFTNTNDSVYAGFYFHEAVRLIKRPSRLHLAPGTDEKGLNIGLGIGVAASSLIQHGVDMDIVEIDPQVVNFARDYFGLDTVKGHVFVQDGRDFVETSQLGVYDYVIHDVFTGGSLPKSLFSFEVLLRIRQILKRDGVLSVNFVGEGGSRAFDAVTKTLAYVFPYVTCYREETGGKEEHLHNFVFFASSHPIQFRPATESDILGSDWRWFAFSNLQKWEVNLSSILSSPSTIRAPSVQSLSDEEYNVLAQNNFELVKPKGREKKLKDWTEGFVIVDDDNPLDDALYPVAKDHWRIMREVFADKVWYNF